MNEWIKWVDEALSSALADFDPDIRQVPEAMRYSVSAGGKRVRPVLTLGFCAACGGDPRDAVPFGCAVELVHTYSLIHDDLPCMDDDDLRRGRPSCHRKFDEATALLAGDALLTKAFELLAGAPLSAEQRIAAVGTLAGFAGVQGMVGGQELDLSGEHQPRTQKMLEKTDLLKTSALIEAACQLGVIAAGGSDENRYNASVYGHNLGLAFQIVDDILDATGDAATLGKPIGSDAENGKTTYLSLLGLEQSEQAAEIYTARAMEALNQFSESNFLKQFTNELLHRKH